MSAARRARRQADHRRPSGAFSTFEGVPVYDATVVQEAGLADADGVQRDSRVMLGIGPAGGRPVAYVMLCPCEGVRGLVGELQEIAAVAAEHHPDHDWPASWPAPL